MALALVLLWVVLPFVFPATVEVDWGNGKAWPHIWEACVGSGHAALGLRADWREHLATVRFHGLFDDDMNVVLPTGTSFYNIDSVYDYILSLGMEPLVELSFSPAALATTNKTLFHYIAHISPPEPTAWYALIKEFGQHIQQRYSKATVEQWYFEVWNEPNCGFLDAPPDKIYQAYYDLYNNTASALKAANPKLQVGGPVTCQSDWVDPFLTWSKQNNVPVDFISTHLYPTDPNVVNGNTAPVILQTIATVRKHSATLPVFYSEYNDGLFNDPPLHDDPFAAAAILKTLSDLDGKLPLLSWWTFSDVFEEQGMPSQEFDKPNFTGWGLLSASGIPKPVYRAFQLLHASGDKRFLTTVRQSSSVGSLVTFNSATHETMIFLWNYFWPTNSTKVTENVSVLVKGLKQPGSVKMARIDDNNANAPQAWRVKGSPKYLTPAEITELKKVSELTWTSTKCSPVTDGCSLPSILIQPQGVVVFVISKD